MCDAGSALDPASFKDKSWRLNSRKQVVREMDAMQHASPPELSAKLRLFTHCHDHCLLDHYPSFHASGYVSTREAHHTIHFTTFVYTCILLSHPLHSHTHETASWHRARGLPGIYCCCQLLCSSCRPPPAVKRKDARVFRREGLLRNEMGMRETTKRIRKDETGWSGSAEENRGGHSTVIPGYVVYTMQNATDKGKDGAA